MVAPYPPVVVEELNTIPMVKGVLLEIDIVTLSSTTDFTIKFELNFVGKATVSMVEKPDRMKYAVAHKDKILTFIE